MCGENCPFQFEILLQVYKKVYEEGHWKGLMPLTHWGVKTVMYGPSNSMLITKEE